MKLFNIFKDIEILYKRSDKRTKEAELERHYRVNLQRRISRLEHQLRTANFRSKKNVI